MQAGEATWLPATATCCCSRHHRLVLIGDSLRFGGGALFLLVWPPAWPRSERQRVSRSASSSTPPGTQLWQPCGRRPLLALAAASAALC